MTQLPIVKPETEAPKAATKGNELSKSDIAKLYTDMHWTERGYCLEYTSNKAVLFHPASNKTVCTDAILDEFEGWRRENNIYIKTEDYVPLMNSLVTRVKSHMQKVYGSGFRPIKDRFYVDSHGVPLANTFIPFDPPAPTNTAPPPLLMELFQRIAPVDEERQQLIEWTAAIFQRPLERPIWGVIMTGNSKCGKSSLVSVINVALGGNHVNDSVTYVGLWEQFSTVWADYKLIAVEDQIAPRDADTKMKQAMSAKSKMFSLKGEQKQVKRDMFSRTVITSNDRRPLRLDPSVRRWLALQFIDHLVDEPESVEFFNKFYAWLATPEAAAEIRHYFMNVELKVYNPNLCIRTATLEEMIGLSTSVLEAVIKDFVSDGHSFVDGQLHSHIRGELPDMGARDIADLIKKHLVNEGYRRTRREITGLKGKRYVWWKSPPGARGEALRHEDEASMVEYIGAPPF